jgi:hypothetical protein
VIRLPGGAVTLVKGDLADLLDVLPSCRLITMNHVIEHLPDPLSVVSALIDRLEPGGFFEGQTPGADSYEHRIFGGRWSGYHAPRHTAIFSRHGLRRLLERAGFESVGIAGAFNPAGLAVSLASLPQGRSPGVIPRHGVRWLFFLGLAALLAPLDLCSGAPGILNFVARKRSA